RIDGNHVSPGKTEQPSRGDLARQVPGASHRPGCDQDRVGARGVELAEGAVTDAAVPQDLAVLEREIAEGGELLSGGTREAEREEQGKSGRPVDARGRSAASGWRCASRASIRARGAPPRPGSAVRRRA